MSTSELQRLGLELPSDRPPHFVAAGVIKHPNDIVRYSQIPELAALVIGDFSYEENTVDNHDRPTFLYDSLNSAAYNAVKLANCGHERANFFVRSGIRRVKDAGQLAIIGVTALKHEDPREIIPKLAYWARETGAQGVEINGSCPNEDKDDLLCHDVETSLEVVSLTREIVGPDFYIIFKFSDLPLELMRAYYAGHLAANAISSINSLRHHLQPSSALYRDYSQSGPIIRGVARDNLARWRQETAGYDLWSVGGVADGFEAYYRNQNGGALLVGGAQAFHRTNHPERIAAQWAAQYNQRAASSSVQV